MNLTVAHDFLPKQNSTRAAQVMDHFGIGFEQGRHLIAENLEIPVQAGDVVLFTGASGSGKSSLMRATAGELHRTAGGDEAVIDVTELSLPDQILIDALPGTESEAMHLLSACGLGEAHLMLRTPRELSDGQRYRFRLALGLARNPDWLLADEFTATLDRTLAKVIAFNVRRLADRTGRGFLLATTHEDVAADLLPDIHVRCRIDGDVNIECAADDGRQAERAPRLLECVRGANRLCTLPPESAAHANSSSRGAESGSPDRVKKKRATSRSSTNSGSAERPSAIGRTSLGGITGVITSD